MTRGKKKNPQTPLLMWEVSAFPVGLWDVECAHSDKFWQFAITEGQRGLLSCVPPLSLCKCLRRDGCLNRQCEFKPMYSVEWQGAFLSPVLFGCAHVCEQRWRPALVPLLFRKCCSFWPGGQIFLSKISSCTICLQPGMSPSCVHNIFIHLSPPLSETTHLRIVFLIDCTSSACLALFFKMFHLVLLFIPNSPMNWLTCCMLKSLSWWWIPVL